ncbi:MAG: hypothetical protein KVP17_001829 [Porospora cf. gigantea B]|uniref:uncharacterized protein n=1 Tax=Porospora cf. gigantea B TaxID=2853592 RepID=UPI003571A740|nr:MAG: hypothetical protein KVP17_001829 [Porospora cf. gigantea B]
MASEMSPPPNDNDMCDVVTLKDLFLVRDAPLKVAFTDNVGNLSILTLHHPAFVDDAATSTSVEPDSSSTEADWMTESEGCKKQMCLGHHPEVRLVGATSRQSARATLVGGGAGPSLRVSSTSCLASGALRTRAVCAVWESELLEDESPQSVFETNVSTPSKSSPGRCYLNDDSCTQLLWNQKGCDDGSPTEPSLDGVEKPNSDSAQVSAFSTLSAEPLRPSDDDYHRWERLGPNPSPLTAAFLSVDEPELGQTSRRSSKSMSADADSLGEAADGEGSSACLSVDEPELGQTSRRSSKSMSADADSAEEAVDGQGSSEVPATGDSISDSSSESEELGSSSRGPEVPEKGDSSSSSDSHSSSDSEELESLTENLRPRPVYPDIVPLEALPTTDVSACSLTPRSARSVGWRPDVPPVNRRDVLEPQSATSTDSADSLVVGEGAATSCVPWDDEDRPSSSCNSSWSLPSSSGEEDPTSSTGHAADASSRSDDSTPPCQVGFGQRMAPENCLRNESSSESSLSVSDSHGGPSDKAEDCRDQAASDDEWLGARAAPCLRTGASIFEWRPRVGAYRCATATDKAEEPVSVAKSAVSLVASPPAAHSSRSLATPPVSEGTKAPAACSSRSLATPPVAEGTKISVDELSVLPRYYGPHRTFLPHAQNARRHSLSRLLTSLPELDVTAVDVQGEVNVNLRMELADMKRGISIYHNRLVLLSRHRETIARPAPSYATMCEKLPQLGAHVSSLSPHKQRRSLLRACMAMVQAATTRILDMEGYLQSTSSYLRTVEDQISQNLKSRKKCSGGLRQSLERVQQLRQVHATPTTHRLLTPHWVARRLATVQHPTFQPLKIQLAALAPRVQALGVECRQRYNEVHVRAKQRQEATRWRRLSAMNRRNNRCARREREREETLKLVSVGRTPYEVCAESRTSGSAALRSARQPLGYANWTSAFASGRTPRTAADHRGLKRR